MLKEQATPANDNLDPAIERNVLLWKQILAGDSPLREPGNTSPAIPSLIASRHLHLPQLEPDLKA